MTAIRMIKIKDASQLLPLMKQLGYPQTLANMEERLTICLESGIYFCLAFELNKEILGVCFFTVYPSCLKPTNRCIIEALVVDEKHRNQGIATKLLQETESLARRKGCDSISLTSNKGRGQNIYNFYVNHGYKNDGLRAQWYLTKVIK